MLKFSGCLICVIILFSGCKKERKVIQNIYTNHIPPTAFTVKVVDREDTYAAIQWTNSMADDSSQLTYSVSLNGVTLVTELTNTTYTIKNLSDTLAYNGVVTAIDKRGLMATDTFTINKAPGTAFTSNDSYFTCYTLGGDQRWTIPGSFTTFPARSNDTIFAEGYGICALDQHTGTRFWTYPFSSEQGGGLVYYHGKLYTNLPTSNKILALDAKTGNLIWQINGGGAYQPTISKGVLYYTSNIANGTLNAINAATGTLLWSKGLSDQVAIPAAANGIAFIQTSTSNSTTPGYLYGFDATTGNLKWRFSYPGGIGSNYQSRPVIIANTVYFLGNQDEYDSPNTLYAININTGNLLWQTVVFNGASYGTIFGGADGIYLNAYQRTAKYDLNTGAALWSVPNNGDSEGVGDVAITPLGLYFYMFQYPNTRYLQSFNDNNGTPTSNAKTIPNGGGYLFVIDGKSYYPYTSGMNSTN